MLRAAGLFATLALVISACSQAPADVAAPTLEPQFGSADNDFGVDVALGSSGHIFSLSEREGYSYDQDGYRDGRQDWAVLRRYDASGTMIWSRDVATEICLDAYDYGCTGNPVQVRALVADASGSTYSLLSNQYVSGDVSVTIPLYVYKHDSAGKLVRSVYIGTNGIALGSSADPSSDAVDIAVDGAANFYIVRRNATFDREGEITAYTNVVAKYSSTGSLVWQRTSPVGTPYSVTVSSNGNVYVAGSTGVAKYTNAGNQSWKISGDTRDVVAVGTNTVYARNLTTVRKLDANGKQLWSKAQTGLSGLVIGDMTTDSSANVYITGKYNASSTNRDVFTRKLSASSGATSFTKTFGTTAYDDARGVATLNGSEIYLTGATQGSLAHPFRGGENDGYVRKLSSVGNSVWTR